MEVVRNLGLALRRVAQGLNRGAAGAGDGEGGGRSTQSLVWLCEPGDQGRGAGVAAQSRGSPGRGGSGASGQTRGLQRAVGRVPGAKLESALRTLGKQACPAGGRSSLTKTENRPWGLAAWTSSVTLTSSCSGGQACLGWAHEGMGGEE